MTDDSLDRLKVAFDTEPTFKFFSPEGHGGFPTELAGLPQLQVEHLIAIWLDYERDADKFDAPAPGAAAVIDPVLHSE